MRAGYHPLIPVVAICLSLLARPAFGGQREDEAATLAKAGQLLFEAGKYENALTQFKDAYSRFDPPRFVIPEVIWNIGRCHEELGDLLSALRAFEEFEKYADTPEYKAAAQKKVAEVRDKVMASVTLSVEPAGALVKVDGADIGTAPLSEPVELMPGRHVLSLSRKGFRPREETLDIKARETRTVRVSLEARVGHIDIAAKGGSVGEARVLVDGSEAYRGPLPATIQVPAGEHVVRAYAQSGEPAERLLDVPDAGRVPLVLKYRAPTPPPVVPVVATTRPKPDVVPSSFIPVVQETAKAPVSKVKAGLFWGGLAAALAGGVLQIAGYTNYSNVNGGTGTYADKESARNTAQSLYYAAYGLYAAGGLCMITSFFADKGKHPFGFGAAPTQNGVAVSASVRW